MKDPVFSFDTWEPYFPIDQNIAVDAKGQIKLRVSEHMAMDVETGELHFTTPWPSDDKD